MFINLSNHALQNWSTKQKEEAEKYGELIDLPFPNISPYADSVEIDRLVEKYLKKVLEYHNPVVMLQGEFIFTFRLATKLKAAGIKVRGTYVSKVETDLRQPAGILSVV